MTNAGSTPASPAAQAVANDTRESVSSPVAGVPDQIAAESIRAQVQRILAGRRFATSERHCRLLLYLTEQTLAGLGGGLKEYAIGVEVFDRRESFDPQTDPIVRTELSRFRAKLKDYYASDGRDDDLIIDLPKRSHCLTFRLKKAPAANAEPKPARRWLGWRLFAVVTCIMLAAIATSFWALVEGSDRARETKALHRGITSIAVLPFVNLSADRETEYFSDGLTEELIHWLAEIDGLRVVSRTSAFQFKGKNADLGTITAQLHVDAVLEGTVRKFGGRLRVTARLVDGADGFELRSHIWERGIEDALTVQQGIARRVANTLRNDQFGGRDLTPGRSTDSSEAYRRYHEGLHHANSRTELDLRRAIACFEGAIAADPDYVMAQAGLANAYIHLGLLNEMPPGDAMLRAKRAAQSAVEKGDAYSHAHSALGSVLALYDWNWAAAEREFQRAIGLDPNDSEIREAYAMHCLLPQGRLNSALFELQFAQRLDPLSSQIMFGVAKVHHFNRDSDRAIQAFQRVVRVEPDSEAVPMGLASAYLQKGLVHDALDTLRDASAPTEDEARLAIIGKTYALSGQRDRARGVLDQLHKFARHRYVSGYYVAMIHLALGEKEEALNWLEEAAAERSPLIVYLGVNPRFDSLRAEPRFIALLKKAGLSGERSTWR